MSATQRDKAMFRHESLQDGTTIGELLQAVCDGLEQGILRFSDDSDAIIMKPKGLLHLKLSAEVEDGRNRFNIRVTWHDAPDAKPKQKALSVNAKQKKRKHA
ncbi:MAG: amphi-Trp domain-containing protein [Mariprofundales bacterium]|nr:amphi-Trp domain-containing protein [Mariprofundales bacterium]